MAQFLKTLLTLSLAGGALTALLLLAERLLGRRIPSRALYLAWLLVLLRLALPVPGLLAFPAAADGGTAALIVAESAQTPRSYYGAEVRDPETAGPDAAHDVPDDAAESRTGVRTVDPEPVKRADDESEAQRKMTAWTLAFGLWAVGASVCLGWQLYAYFRYRRALFRSLRPATAAELSVLNALNPRPWPLLWHSPLADSPLLLGLLRPVIVLPVREYSPETLDGILRHELCHWRQGDLAAKWFAAAVLSAHWFNPLLWPLRGALDRACELSCDAALLRDMDRNEQQRYGELLLSLAAARPLPRRVVALSFATAKRDLKERLVQIMKFKKRSKAALALTLAALLLLGGCAVAMGPAAVPQAKTDPAELSAGTDAASVEETIPTEASADAAESPLPTPEPLRADESGNGQEITVSTVDGFLAALGSDRVIVLEPGNYDLTTATGYGGEARVGYSWAEVRDGYELVLEGLQRLSIVSAADAGSVNILTEPRYANVLRLEDCRTVELVGLTAGHTLQQGECTGGVIRIDGCDNVSIQGCDLYGCGSIGIEAVNCRRVLATDTVIEECSYGALRAQNSYDFRFEGGEIRNCGWRSSDGCFDLLQTIATTGFSVVNTEISGNRAQLMLADSWCAEVKLLGCRVHDNEFHEGMRNQGASPLLLGCFLRGNVPEPRLWYVDQRYMSPAVDAEGNELTPDDLERMEWQPCESDSVGIPVTTAEKPEGKVVDGIAEYRVSTVDELLACIGSNTRIYLDAALFDLTTAAQFGG